MTDAGAQAASHLRLCFLCRQREGHRLGEGCCSLDFSSFEALRGRLSANVARRGSGWRRELKDSPDKVPEVSVLLTQHKGRVPALCSSCHRSQANVSWKGDSGAFVCLGLSRAAGSSSMPVPSQTQAAKVETFPKSLVLLVLSLAEARVP